MKNTVKAFAIKHLRTLLTPAFGILLLIAFMMWFLGRLAYNYTTEIDVEVVMEVDYSAGVWAPSTPIELTVLASGTGRSLLRYKLGMGRRVVIPLSSVRLEPLAGAKDGYLRQIDEESLRTAINARQGSFRAEMIVTALEPISVSDIVEVRLPVRATGQISCAPQYIISSPLQFTPDSLSVKLPSLILDTMTAVRTMPLELIDMNHDHSGIVQLQLPSGVVCQTSVVRYKVGVSKYTEYGRQMFVKFSDGRSVVTDPARVDLRLRVMVGTPEAEVFDNLELATSTHPEPNTKDVYRVLLKGDTKHIASYRITPEFVKVVYLVD